MSEQNNNLSNVTSSKKDWKRSKNNNKRVHVVSENFNDRKEKYLELKEMRQKLKHLRSEKLVEV